MNKNRKKYVQINNHTSSDQIFALLDNVQSDDEEDIEELVNDSDKRFFANETRTYRTLFPILTLQAL